MNMKAIEKKSCGKPTVTMDQLGAWLRKRNEPPETIERIFASLDEDGNGVITKGELTRILRATPFALVLFSVPSCPHESDLLRPTIASAVARVRAAGDVL